MPILNWSSSHFHIDSTLLFIPGGDVNDWCTQRTVELKTMAIEKAPPNRSSSRFYQALRKSQSTGRLAAAITGSTGMVGDRIITMRLGVREEMAPHADYVLGGTARNGTGYIYTPLGYANYQLITAAVMSRNFKMYKGEKGWVLNLPETYHEQHLYLRVKGQRANPFITDAYAAVARVHTALPRVTFGRTLD